MSKSLQSEQEYLTPGQHYSPWQKARVLADNREVWIVRQNGDGERAWYFTSTGEKLAPEEIEWI